jgi:hypothetical protein
MNEVTDPQTASSPDEDPVAKWWVECGNPLKNALRWIVIWRPTYVAVRLTRAIRASPVSFLSLYRSTR